MTSSDEGPVQVQTSTAKPNPSESDKFENRHRQQSLGFLHPPAFDHTKPGRTRAVSEGCIFDSKKTCEQTASTTVGRFSGATCTGECNAPGLAMPGCPSAAPTESCGDMSRMRAGSWSQHLVVTSPMSMVYKSVADFESRKRQRGKHHAEQVAC